MPNSADKFFKEIKNKRIAFCGIGISNLPLIKLFHDKGAVVTACDHKSREELMNIISELKKLDIEIKLGKDYMKDLNVDIMFRTPGINFFTKELVDARKRGIVVTSEMEVFFDLCPCKIIGVTGSDGKTTTTTIISEMLKQDGKVVHLGGNIGTPLLPIIEKIDENDVAVVELSSFQLISMRKSPDIAVITNLAPNHLDVHKDMTEYIEAKKNIFMHQNAFSSTILNKDNDITSKFSDLVRGRTLFFSKKEKCSDGTYLCKNGDICVSSRGYETFIINKKDIRIPGEHNVENYMAAISSLFGIVSKKSMVEVAKKFNGVEHRTEFVREVNGVKYYNDSIASSPTRTSRGTLSLFNKKIILIAGGYDKKIPFDVLGPIIVDKVKLLILMGQTANKIKDAVVNSSEYRDGNPDIVVVNNMDRAVEVAYKHAIPGDIVSLSPACASFGLYENFMQRGLHFKELVRKL